ncbi:hypothetical protein [Sorangium sp. So ce1000]|uniref:hypothetical protein n=1 Tax=Sorangium sp. So ce1000 TaxID=3133325 RepID=UPI003F62DF2E
MLSATAESVPEHGLAVNRAGSAQSGVILGISKPNSRRMWPVEGATWSAGAGFVVWLAGCDEIAQYFPRARAKTTS